MRPRAGDPAEKRRRAISFGVRGLEAPLGQVGDGDPLHPRRYDPVEPPLQLLAVGVEVEAEIAARVARETLQRAPEHALRPRQVAPAEVVEGHRDLDEPLEEI